ncbi:hypothetical protein GsuE55_36200 [Geobacillus subterraneus]|uniref:Uncharacterized protein n=1 Tax=Geobacillus subterraneus TaxID=129338 RepID=A0A679FXE4_9BACL|nr:hypothetical protein B4113_1301 [Geobacillus sp. B4113_201601]BBW98787.1 hypothetical protein GsuE55_36200 [Geobacillus subterraneus]
MFTTVPALIEWFTNALTISVTRWHGINCAWFQYKTREVRTGPYWDDTLSAEDFAIGYKQLVDIEQAF